MSIEKIAPFRLNPYFSPRPWGFKSLSPWYDIGNTTELMGEVWLSGDMCVVSHGQFAGKNFKEIVANSSQAILGSGDRGVDSPLLLKVIFAQEKLSVQVHPNDEMAQKHHNQPRGKTECWYALDAEPGANVALGLKDGTTKPAILAAIQDGTLESLLTWLPMSKGDMVFVDAGTVHAIAPGSVLFECQQNCDLTYRLFDYGRGRELHLELGIEATLLKTDAGKVAPVPIPGGEQLIKTKYFSVQRRKGALANIPEDAAKAGTIAYLFVSSGKISLSGPEFEGFQLSRGDLAILPANSTEWQLIDSSGAEVLLIQPVYEGQ